MEDVDRFVVPSRKELRRQVRALAFPMAVLLATCSVLAWFLVSVVCNPEEFVW